MMFFVVNRMLAKLKLFDGRISQNLHLKRSREVEFMVQYEKFVIFTELFEIIR